MPKTDITVRELVDKVQRNELTLPEMQRRYVWPATRVRDLLDSLYRGYPSGTILVWETDEDIQDRALAIEATKNPTTSQRLLLLDGQQRITSLSAILTGEPVKVRGRKRPIDILFNLEHPDGPPVELLSEDESDFSADIEDIEDEENADRDIQQDMKKRTFVVSSRSLLNDPIWVPVSDIFKKTESQILRSIDISSNDEKWDKYSNRLQKVKKIADYQYVMQVLEKSMSYEEVTEIFVRVNSLGIKLRGSDLALAQITSKWKGFMDLIENFAVQFNGDEDYIIETGISVRMLTIFATHQSRFKTVGKLNKQKLEESWNIATNSLEFAINFIRNNAGIDSLHFLSSPFLLVPIAIYAELNDYKLSNEDEKKILKWFYLAHMRGHYSMGSSESILDADLSILFKKKGLDELINQLQLHVKKFIVDSNDLAFKGMRSPFFSMLYFILRQNNAKDWWTGLKLADSHVGRAHVIQYHHIFPKSIIKSIYDQKEVNEISNMAFIGGKTNRQITNKEPIKYLDGIIKERGEDALTSQLVPVDSNLWELANYRDFLIYRRKSVAEAINKFMSKFE